MSQSLDIVEQPDPAPAGRSGRPWLGVRFACSGAYLRVYRNPEDRQYRATCPRCGRTVTFRVGPGGTSSRFFEVRC
ncbi:MAG: hypothetical protein JNM80_08965 [Phycisphaerae bacterium]|nr:hypothetical protein [Phycisphaerae bacterium]